MTALCGFDGCTRDAMYWQRMTPAEEWRPRCYTHTHPCAESKSVKPSYEEVVSYAELLERAGRDVVLNLQYADPKTLRQPLTKLVASILALDAALAKNPNPAGLMPATEASGSHLAAEASGAGGAGTCVKHDAGCASTTGARCDCTAFMEPECAHETSNSAFWVRRTLERIAAGEQDVPSVDDTKQLCRDVLAAWCHQSCTQLDDFESWWTRVGAANYECDACTPHDACLAAWEASRHQVCNDDARDAARYRWLRRGLKGCYNKVMIHAGEALDRAVDDGMDQTSPSDLDIDPPDSQSVACNNVEATLAQAVENVRPIVEREAGGRDPLRAGGVWRSASSNDSPDDMRHKWLVVGFNRRPTNAELSAFYAFVQDFLRLRSA